MSNCSNLLKELQGKYNEQLRIDDEIGSLKQLLSVFEKERKALLRELLGFSINLPSIPPRKKPARTISKLVDGITFVFDVASEKWRRAQRVIQDIERKDIDIKRKNKELQKLRTDFARIIREIRGLEQGTKGYVK